MIDAIKKWMPTNAIINKVGPVILSPWTGRPLNPGNFCQAIFVWYGLFNFWQLALANNLYDKEYGEKRIATIQKGFEKVEIDSLNKEFHLQLNDEVLETVEEVKAAVLLHSHSNSQILLNKYLHSLVGRTSIFSQVCFTNTRMNLKVA